MKHLILTSLSIYLFSLSVWSALPSLSKEDLYSWQRAQGYPTKAWVHQTGSSNTERLLQVIKEYQARPNYNRWFPFIGSLVDELKNSSDPTISYKKRFNINDNNTKYVSVNISGQSFKAHEMLKYQGPRRYFSLDCQSTVDAKLTYAVETFNTLYKKKEGKYRWEGARRFSCTMIETDKFKRLTATQQEEYRDDLYNDRPWLKMLVDQKQFTFNTKVLFKAPLEGNPPHPSDEFWDENWMSGDSEPSNNDGTFKPSDMQAKKYVSQGTLSIKSLKMVKHDLAKLTFKITDAFKVKNTATNESLEVEAIRIYKQIGAKYISIKDYNGEQLILYKNIHQLGDITEFTLDITPKDDINFDTNRISYVLNNRSRYIVIPVIKDEGQEVILGSGPWINSYDHVYRVLVKLNQQFLENLNNDFYENKYKHILNEKLIRINFMQSGGTTRYEGAGVSTIYLENDDEIGNDLTHEWGHYIAHVIMGDKWESDQLSRAGSGSHSAGSVLKTKEMVFGEDLATFLATTYGTFLPKKAQMEEGSLEDYSKKYNHSFVNAQSNDLFKLESSTASTLWDLFDSVNTSEVGVEYESKKRGDNLKLPTELLILLLDEKKPFTINELFVGLQELILDSDVEYTTLKDKIILPTGVINTPQRVLSEISHIFYINGLYKTIKVNLKGTNGKLLDFSFAEISNQSKNYSFDGYQQTFDTGMIFNSYHNLTIEMPLGDFAIDISWSSPDIFGVNYFDSSNLSIRPDSATNKIIYKEIKLESF
jgi:hypothetical protein